MAPEAYGEQKRREAVEVASTLGAEVLVAPYKDGQLPDNDETRRYVANLIRQVRPTHVLTHWRQSIHKDHSARRTASSWMPCCWRRRRESSRITPRRGVRAVWYAENWEDADGFRPYTYVAIAPEDSTRWRSAVAKYEFVGGTISSFRYLDYYSALMTVRGRSRDAVARLRSTSTRSASAACSIRY